ncbi:amidase family protein [Bosea sp. (in: a-proteobacteria)]|uniref:amidase family protein n=1 Tax=Bosea sp. (in: a-proteobacteria) TaxID=1871050 RepID=UPI00261118BF|nr:amidase family protein [Bosea sp. (in: a-proteobacteria)]MCO5093590.1 amidase family protein [Bosea sp. (in: a-proteobacteria)]
MNIQDLSQMTLAALREGYAARRISPVEVMERTFAQIDAANGAINALYDLRRDESLAAAKDAAQRFKRGTPAGALDGIPVTIKDSVNAVGMTWHHGARLHGAGVKGASDAPPTAKLKAAGAIIIAKTTMPDFGLSGSGVSSCHGIARNPWGLAWNTGGSSAGAGASLAAGIGVMSVGSDIAGSVRLPASHCGLAALKPTQGMIPHTPASDVRSAGPMTRHAADLEAHLRILGGVHQEDRFSVPVVEASGGFEAARVAVYRDFGFGPPVEPAVIAVLEAAERALGELVAEVSCKDAAFDHDIYLAIDDLLKLRGWREYAPASAVLRQEIPAGLLNWFKEAEHWNGDRIALFEREIARGVLQTAQLFDEADFLLTPVMPVVNFPAEECGLDPAMPLRHCTFTAPFNQSGHPAVSLCGGFDARGLPVGVQLVGRRFDDVRLCRLATALEARMRAAAGAIDWPLEPRH